MSYADDIRGACIPWPGGPRVTGGYGQLTINTNKRQLAHRFVWMTAHGPIPPGMVIMHRCDNPICVNLAHLRLGTGADNHADMMAKGRNSNQQPSKTHCPEGHPYDTETRQGWRRCKQCMAQRCREYRARRHHVVR